MPRWLQAVLVLVLGLAFAPAAGAVELLVIASNIPEVEEGWIIDGSAAVALPAGAELTLMAEDGGVITVTGPFEGVVELGQGAAGEDDQGILVALSDLFVAGEDGSTTTGAIRSAAAAGTPPGPWYVDLGRSGDHCIWRGRPCASGAPIPRAP